MSMRIKKDSEIIEDNYGRPVSRGKATRKDALYRGLPEKNARKIQRACKKKGLKTHAVKNAYGTYDIYRSD